MKNIITLTALTLGLNSLAFANVVHTITLETISSANPFYEVDFNSDGIIDSEIAFNSFDMAYQFNGMPSNPNQASLVSTVETDVTYGTQLNVVTHLINGSMIGPSQNFYQPVLVTAGMVMLDYELGGPFFDCPVTESYVGAKFIIAGNVHYGWIRMRRVVTQEAFNRGIEIVGYAYESTPDTPIEAGDTGTSTASIIDDMDNTISVFPNPAHNFIKISTNDQLAEGKVTILDISGREMIAAKIESNLTEVSISNFPKGTYLIQLFDEKNELRGTKKLWKK